MENSTLKEISKKMNAFLALLMLKDIESMTTADKVKLLLRFDLSNQDIADILSTTKRTIEVTKSRVVKNKK